MTRETLRLIRVIGPISAVILCLGATAWLSVRGALRLEEGLELVRQQVLLSDLAARSNAEYQLSVTKAKNYAMLGDALNRRRSEDYMAQAQASTDALLKQAPEGDRAQLRNLAESLGRTAIRLQALWKDDLKAGSAVLYRRHLQDITIPFDQAAQSYNDALHARALALKDEVARRFAHARAMILLSLGLAIGSLIFALVTALGIGRQLRLALDKVAEGSHWSLF